MRTLIRATNLWGFDDLVREFGGDPDDLLSRFHIAGTVARENDAFVPFAAFVRVLEEAAVELGCPDFGLRLSQWQGLDILGPIAVIARNAQSLREGLDAVAEYLYVHSPALRLALVPADAASDLRYAYEANGLGLHHMWQGYELSMANAVRIIQLLGGPGAAPSTVSFLHERVGPKSAYDEALGCAVRFAQPWCGFELPADLAARPIQTAHPETKRIATMYLESRFLPRTALLTERVAELARRLLPTGHCDMRTISAELGMHPRTLQRRLAEEGAQCQEVIDRARRDQAARYLAEPDLYLSQIAGMLGYAEQSTFNRSCRRWFGKTPRQYRADLMLSP
jgi:AraC-like DNA-binding protein